MSLHLYLLAGILTTCLYIQNVVTVKQESSKRDYIQPQEERPANLGDFQRRYFSPYDLEQAPTVRSTISGRKWVELQPTNFLQNIASPLSEETGEKRGTFRKEVYVLNNPQPTTEQNEIDAHSSSTIGQTGDKRGDAFHREALVLGNPQPSLDQEGSVNHLLRFAHDERAMTTRKQLTTMDISSNDFHPTPPDSKSWFLAAMGREELPDTHTKSKRPIKQTKKNSRYRYHNKPIGITTRRNRMKTSISRRKKNPQSSIELSATQRTIKEGHVPPTAKYSLRRIFDNHTSEIISKGEYETYIPTLNLKKKGGKVREHSDELWDNKKMKEFKDTWFGESSKFMSNQERSSENLDHLHLPNSDSSEEKSIEVDEANSQQDKEKQGVNNKQSKNDDDSDSLNSHKINGKTKDKGQLKDDFSSENNDDIFNHLILPNKESKTKNKEEKEEREEDKNDRENHFASNNEENHNENFNPEQLTSEGGLGLQGNNDVKMKKIRNKLSGNKIEEHKKGENKDNVESDDEELKTNNLTKEELEKARKLLKMQKLKDENDEENNENKYKPKGKVKEKLAKEKELLKNENMKNNGEVDGKNKNAKNDENNVYKPKGKTKEKLEKETKMIKEESPKNEKESASENVYKPKGKVKEKLDVIKEQFKDEASSHKVKEDGEDENVPLPKPKESEESKPPTTLQEIKNAKEKQATSNFFPQTVTNRLLQTVTTFSYDKTAVNGPLSWYLMNPEWTCKGRKQSPINIDTSSIMQDQLAKNIIIKHSPPNAPLSGVFKNNGHAPTLSLSNAISVKLFGGNLVNEYHMKQLHFHFGCDDDTGSEHWINGIQFPLEMHLVFWDKSVYPTFAEAAKGDRGIAVLAVLFQLEVTHSGPEELTPLEGISKLVENIYNEGDSIVVPEELNVRLETILPNIQVTEKSDRIFTYDGSLSTPGCYESVVWVVSGNHPVVTAKQLNIFRKLKSTKVNLIGTMCNNYRPLQKKNGRKIYSNII